MCAISNPTYSSRSLLLQFPSQTPWRTRLRFKAIRVGAAMERRRNRFPAHLYGDLDSQIGANSGSSVRPATPSRLHRVSSPRPVAADQRDDLGRVDLQGDIAQNRHSTIARADGTYVKQRFRAVADGPAFMSAFAKIRRPRSPRELLETLRPTAPATS